MSFDFDAAVTAPFRMQPGLRRLAPGSLQLTPVSAAHRGVARHLREKLAVLGAFPDEALLCAPGFDARPALLALAAHAQAEHPAAFSFDGHRLEARGIGWAATLDGEVSPLPGRYDWPEIGTVLGGLAADWRFAALLALACAEDFAIVDGHAGTIPWLAVALPSGWAPVEKVGLPFAAVHAPVADSRLVLQAGPSMMRLVCEAPAWERFVWTVAPHPRLHAHPRRVAADRWEDATSADELAALAWWRTERQTFIPLPALAQSIFTIQVEVQPLHRAIDSPARARQLGRALESMSPAVLAYRGLERARDRLLDWLARRAASPVASSAGTAATGNGGSGRAATGPGAADVPTT